jgi:hypothetical protein
LSHFWACERKYEPLSFRRSVGDLLTVFSGRATAPAADALKVAVWITALCLAVALS